MGDIKFNGDFQHISERQLQFISSVLKEKGYDGANVTIEPVGKAGDNYSSNVNRIIAVKDGNEFKMIAKIAHNLEEYRQAMPMNEIFRNESAMYEEVLSKFTELEKQAGIPDNERLRYATCYGVLLEAPHEVILLEDLQVSGFVILDRFKSLSDHDIKLVLKDFAKLHSLSYALKNKEPEVFERLKQQFAHLWEMFIKSQTMIMFFQQLEKGLLALVDKEEHKSILKGLDLSRSSELMSKLFKTDAETRFSVIQQGDSWTNNIMFKLEDDKTTECCMIDYQQVKAISPVADLVYMLFNCTDYETRKEHFHDWIDYYHDQLGKCLSEYGLKVNYVYPRDQLDADLKRYGKVSMAQSALLAAILIRGSEDVEKMNAMMMQGNVSMEQMTGAMRPDAMDMSSIVRFKSRVEGLINSHRELGFI